MEKIKDIRYYKLLDEENIKKDSKMIPLSFDYLAKAFFQRNENYLRMFLNSELDDLNIDFEDKTNTFRFINTEIPKESKDEHFNHVDILVVVNETITIDIEINTERFEDIFGRNFIYLLKLTVSTFKKNMPYKDIKNYDVIQLNINTNKIDKNKGEVINIGDIKSPLKEKIGNYVIYRKDVEYYKKLYYNQGKLSKGELWLLLFSAKTYVELYSILCLIFKEEKDINDFMEEMIKLNNEDFILTAEEKHALDQMVIDTRMERERNEGKLEGKAEGKLEGKLEGEKEGIEKVAKEMIKEGIELDKISKMTNLSIDYLKSLKKNM